MKTKLLSILSSIGALFVGCFGGSCGIACLAGGCCGGTALLGFIGLSGATMSFLSKLTPVFLALTVITLAYAFYKAYKPKKVSCCETTSEGGNNNSSCCEKEKPKSFFQSKTFLWITTVLSIVMWTYPLVFNNKSESSDNASCCPATADNSSSSCCPSQNNLDTTFNSKAMKITPAANCRQ